MLRSLYIQNYALIEKLEIYFEAGFSVVTGETGAGKSIMLGAIGLLLGQRADVRVIRQGASKCVIEARFDIANYAMQDFFERNDLEYDDECILRRELQSSGKSRGFINDTPVSLALMKVLGEQLIDVHSQHQNLLLNTEGFQLNVLDLLAHDDALLKDYQLVFNEWQRLDKDLKDLKEQADKNREEEEYIRFQLNQLDEAQLCEGEQEELERESEMLTYAEEIKAGLYRVEQTFISDESGLLGVIKEAVDTLAALVKVYQPAQELSERLQGAYIDIKDIVGEISDCIERVEFNPERLSKVNERLNLLYSLMQKHRLQSDAELVGLAESYRNKLEEITSYDERIALLEQQCREQQEKAAHLADNLTAVRKEAAHRVEEQMCRTLVPLGMPNVRFVVELGKRKQLSVHGGDTVAFLFSANKNGTLQNISLVASGGEIARVMLSVKAMIAGEVKLPTIIFDEIDTGVSGEIADRMADIMEEMGRCKRQVLSITHLPQIAARGTVHYKVYKLDNEVETCSHIRRLTDEERVKEIAHMLSGSTLTEAALDNARVLLGMK